MEGDKSNDITANAVHPGLVLTEVTRNFNAIIQTLYALANPIMKTLQKTPRYNILVLIIVRNN